MTEFKVGDRVKVVRGDLLAVHEIKQGDIAFITEIEHPMIDDYPVHISVDDKSDYAPAVALELMTDQESAPIDLHTVEVIYSYLVDVIETANTEGGSHEAVNIAILAYLVGMKEALNG